MLNNFKELTEARGASLCDNINFGKHKGKKLWEIPETYWQTLCSKNGFSYYSLLEKVKESKYNKALLQGRPARRKVIAGNIRESLYSHQKEFVNKFGNLPYANLWAAIGTGKTYAYLEVVRSKIRTGDKILILCPKTEAAKDSLRKIFLYNEL